MATHLLEPPCRGIPYRDIIRRVQTPAGQPERLRRILWTSSFQCETDYVFPEKYGTQRLSFLWAKLAWDFRGDGSRYWNFPDEAAFERGHNGRLGMLLLGTNPVDAETLALFRQETCPTAVTGWFDYEREEWVECEPTTDPLGTRSWEQHRRTWTGYDQAA